MRQKPAAQIGDFTAQREFSLEDIYWNAPDVERNAAVYTNRFK